MAKTRAPLLSLQASGSFGKTITYLRDQRQNIARKYAVGPDPRTPAQVQTRAAFKWANRLWRTAPQDFKDPWELLAAGRPLSVHNLFIGHFVKDSYDQTDLDSFVMSPGVVQDKPLASLVLIGGANNIRAIATAPDPPFPWVVTMVFWALMRDQDPAIGQLFDIEMRSDPSAPYFRNFTGLITGEKYQVGGWPRYGTPGTPKVAYGRSLQRQRTPT